MVNDKKTSYNIHELQKLNLDFTKEQIITNLENDNCEDFIKIFSILSIEEINTIEEAELLFKHLTNNPTPIREAIALKLEEVYKDNYYNPFIKEQFLKSIIDINPNVCRAICNIISNCKSIKINLYNDIIAKINDLIFEIKENDKELGGFFDDAKKIKKNHAKNKKLFSLYWYLEVLSVCIDENSNPQELEFLVETIKFNDYTIREKTAKILAKMKNIDPELLQIAKTDENFYVKNLVYDKINFED